MEDQTAPALQPVDLDAEHLRLLRLFHFIVGGIYALFSLIPVIHLLMGIAFLNMPPDDRCSQHASSNCMPDFFPWIFIGMALIFILVGLAFSGCIILTGRFIGQRRHLTVCQVLAGLECLLVPFGTVLGVFTLVVLSRQGVRRQFEDAARRKSPVEPI